mmetsp:Transcript_3857/g.8464  ORF Transcript_3857/g.8464 Transcript_3857/m.8464 type:complete len:715 (+) Transcript_3857:123-2267(+)
MESIECDNVQYYSDVRLSMSNMSDTNPNDAGKEDAVAPGGNTTTWRLSNVKVGGDNAGKGVPIAVAPPVSSRDDNLCDRMTAAAEITSSSLPLPPMIMTNTTNSKSTNHISPATPMPPSVSIPFRIRSLSMGADTANTTTATTTPTAFVQSQEGRTTLAALYQSSRRSRTNTNSPRKVASVDAAPTATRIPPPPLFAAPSTSMDHNGQSLSRSSAMPLQLQQSGAIVSSSNMAATAAGSADIHKASLRSSRTSSFLHESWNTSMGSLMNSSSSFMSVSLSNVHHNFRSSHESSQDAQNSAAAAASTLKLQATATADERSRQILQVPHLRDINMEDDGDNRKSPRTMLAVPTLSGDSSQSPGCNIASASVECMDEFSSLQVRSREEFELRQGIGGDVRKDRVSSTAKDDKGSTYGDDKDAHSSSSSEEDAGDDDNQEPPKKKNRVKKMEEHFPTPQTPKSCLSADSFDIVAQPSSFVSSINDGVSSPTSINDAGVVKNLEKDVRVPELFEVNTDNDIELGILRMIDDNQEGEGMTPSKVSPVKGPQDQSMKYVNKESPSEKDQRILRRKIQRLLLIRHCSTCLVPNVPTRITSQTDQCVTCDADGGESIPVAKLTQSRSGATCHITSHCAEGKVLCAHIRTCKLENCTFKKCLTSREVLGHYKNCTVPSCGICGPVRALDRSSMRNKGPSDTDRKQRGASDCSSIETIDDEGWLD